MDVTTVVTAHRKESRERDIRASKLKSASEAVAQSLAINFELTTSLNATKHCIRHFDRLEVAAQKAVAAIGEGDTRGLDRHTVIETSNVHSTDSEKVLRVIGPCLRVNTPSTSIFVELENGALYQKVVIRSSDWRKVKPHWFSEPRREYVKAVVGLVPMLDTQAIAANLYKDDAYGYLRFGSPAEFDDVVNQLEQLSIPEK